MDYRTLGRTGLRVSVLGLGCGGHSRLGISQGKGEENAVAVVRKAMEYGVNFIDTAESYGTEEVVGKALRLAATARDSVVLSTKVSPRIENRMRTAEELREAAEAGLRRLQTDYVDILHLHGVRDGDYEYCHEVLVPVLDQLRSDGKIRHLGITEAFAPDPQHAMLWLAVQDDCWDVMMVGFNLINQSARERVLSVTREKNVGVLDMFAVRRALSNPEELQRLMQELAKKGLVNAEAFDADDPLGFLLTEGGAETIPDAAYRFCRDEPGIHVVLSGTGNPEHLAANVRSLAAPALPEPVTARLRALFAHVDGVSGN